MANIGEGWWPQVQTTVIEYLKLCPVCFRSQFCICNELTVKAKIREIHEAMLDAWLGPKEASRDE